MGSIRSHFSVILFLTSFCYFLFVTCCSDKSHQQSEQEQADNDATPLMEEEKHNTSSYKGLSAQDYRQEVKGEATSLLELMNKKLAKLDQNFNESKATTKQELLEKTQKINVFKHKLKIKIERLDSSQSRETLNHLHLEIQRLANQLNAVIKKDTIHSSQ